MIDHQRSQPAILAIRTVTWNRARTNAVAINAKAHEMPISKGPTPPYACAEGGIMLSLRGYCTHSKQHRMQKIIRTTETWRLMHHLIRLCECCGAVSSTMECSYGECCALYREVTSSSNHSWLLAMLPWSRCGTDVMGVMIPGQGDTLVWQLAGAIQAPQAMSMCVERKLHPHKLRNELNKPQHAEAKRHSIGLERSAYVVYMPCSDGTVKGNRLKLPILAGLEAN